MASGSAIAQELASAPFDEMIKNLLLAMVAAQNEANTSFIEGIKELAGEIVEIRYKRKTEAGGEEERIISGNALAFGILPTMLQIQSGVIEVKMAITMERRTDFQVGVKAKAKFWFASVSVDAKYSNTYSYKAEASSYIRIQVAPAPPPQPLMKAIETIARENPPQDKVAS